MLFITLWLLSCCLCLLLLLSHCCWCRCPCCLLWCCCSCFYCYCQFCCLLMYHLLPLWLLLCRCSCCFCSSIMYLAFLQLCSMCLVGSSFWLAVNLFLFSWRTQERTLENPTICAHIPFLGRGPGAGTKCSRKPTCEREWPYPRKRIINIPENEPTNTGHYMNPLLVNSDWPQFPYLSFVLCFASFTQKTYIYMCIATHIWCLALSRSSLSFSPFLLASWVSWQAEAQIV